MMTHELRILEDQAGEPNTTLRAQITWVTVDSANSIPPTLSFNDGENVNPMQDLLNALWDAGYRPSKERVVDNDAIIDAKDKNLGDLRIILFSQLGIKI